MTEGTAVISRRWVDCRVDVPIDSPGVAAVLLEGAEEDVPGVFVAVDGRLVEEVEVVERVGVHRRRARASGRRPRSRPRAGPRLWRRVTYRLPANRRR